MKLHRLDKAPPEVTEDDKIRMPDGSWAIIPVDLDWWIAGIPDEESADFLLEAFNEASKEAGRAYMQD